MITLDEGGRGRGAVCLRPPPARLATLVEHISVTDVRRASPAPGRDWRIVPDDAPHLLWHRIPGPRGDTHRLVLVGARSTYADIAAAGRTATVAVRLVPGAIPALFGMPASELTDRSIPLADLLGRAGVEATERTGDATLVEVPGLLERLLLGLAARGQAPSARARALIAYASAHGGIDGAGRALGLGARMLRLVAHAEIGLGPKHTVRVRRLHRALHMGLARPGRWARAAAAAGYADQAHLTRDCRALLGEPPGAFATRAHR